jgi:hypothetical protein
MTEGGRPEVDLGELGANRLRDYAVRFAFGAAIALVAGLIGMTLGPKLGGVLLGFPAILPASLTLIQKRSGRDEAAIDSVGAILGAGAMVVFAVLVTVAATRLGVVPSLALSLVVWLLVAIALYAAVRGIAHREPSPP